MAAVTTQMASQLRQLIFYHMDNESLENANFLAGRLVALEPRNPDSLHLLALTYLRMRRWKAAKDISSKSGMNGKHLGCAYVFALACDGLEEYQDGITALDKAKTQWIGCSHWNKHSETTRKHLPDAGMVWNLLAKLWRGHGDLHKAGECFIEAHKLNPLIWDSFTGLCDIGADVNIDGCFALTTEMAEGCTPASKGQMEEPRSTGSAIPAHMNGQSAVSTPANDPFVTNGKTGGDWSFQFPKMKGKNMFGSPPKITAQSSWETPTTNGNDADAEMGGIEHDTLGAPKDAPPAAPIRRSKTLARLGFDSSRDPSRLQAPALKSLGRTHSETTDGEDAASGTSRPTVAHKRTHSGHNSTTSDTTSQPRRSNRLFGQLTSSKPSSRAIQDPSTIATKREDARKTRPVPVKGRSTVGRVVSGNRKVMPPGTDAKDSRSQSRNSVTIPPAASKPAETVVLPDTVAIESLLSIFKQLGLGYLAHSQFDSKSAVEAYQALPPNHKDTAWVQGQLGKAYYEAAEYSKAEQAFEKMLKMQPTRIEDTEYYSTVLWQLKKPVQLSYLAHVLKDLDYEAPQTWCAVGNAFSANRDHQQAIVCFKRAVQIDPKFYYAWTLMGHELLTIENFDEAIRAYRKGVGHERRGYAGWYGLGKCFERMGKYEEAERHYRIAAGINQQNHVLFICIGVVLERLKHRREALVQYTHAIQLCPTSAMGRFRKARTLLILKMYPEALEELTELIMIAPEEANVWFMLGKCHKALHNRGEALKCFTTALNLDAKATMYIKEAMEGIDDSEEEESDSD